MTVSNSRIEGTEHQDVGARLQQRYVDGVMTGEPLWPWPMEGRAQAELGLSVNANISPYVAMNIYKIDVSPQTRFTHSAQLVTGVGLVNVSVKLSAIGVYTQPVTIEASSSDDKVIVEPASVTLKAPESHNFTLRLTGSEDAAATGSYRITFMGKSAGALRTQYAYIIVAPSTLFLPSVQRQSVPRN